MYENSKGLFDSLGRITGYFELDQVDYKFLCLLSDLGFELEVDGDAKEVRYQYFKNL